MSTLGLPQYPAMLTTESGIWSEWQAANPGFFDALEYNVRVGKGFDPGPGVEDFARRAAIMNTQLRLDIVARKGADWWIVEVKRRAGAPAVGQLLQYEILFEETYPTARPIKLGMVTDTAKMGLSKMCDRYHVTLWQLTPNPRA